jgi:hypothetical protein
MGSAVDDKVFVQADGVALVGFNGEGDTAVVADIAYLAMLEKVARLDIVPVQAHHTTAPSWVSSRSTPWLSSTLLAAAAEAARERAPRGTQELRHCGQTRDCSYVAGASGALPRAPVSSLRDVIPSFGNSRYRCDPTVRGER